MANGALVRVLIHTDVTKYLYFKAVDGSFVYNKGKVIHYYIIFPHVSTSLLNFFGQFYPCRYTKFLQPTWRLSSLLSWAFLRNVVLANSSFMFKTTMKTTPKPMKEWTSHVFQLKSLSRIYLYIKLFLFKIFLSI